MYFSQTYRNALFAATVVLLAASQSREGAIVIGSADSMNAMPFDDVTSGTYQQIYASSDFGVNPVTLTGVTFFGQSASTITAATYTVDVSTTAAALGSFTLYTPGADNTREFTGLLSGPITGGSFTIPFSLPFNYNPAAGNLLPQITVSGGPSSPGGLGFSTQSNGGTLFSRAYNVFSGTTPINSADSTGLVTQFNTPAGPCARSRTRNPVSAGKRSNRRSHSHAAFEIRSSASLRFELMCARPSRPEATSLCAIALSVLSSEQPKKAISRSEA